MLMTFIQGEADSPKRPLSSHPDKSSAFPQYSKRKKEIWKTPEIPTSKQKATKNLVWVSPPAGHLSPDNLRGSGD
jgi:hypothetical protein